MQHDRTPAQVAGAGVESVEAERAPKSAHIPLPDTGQPARAAVGVNFVGVPHLPLLVGQAVQAGALEQDFAGGQVQDKEAVAVVGSGPRSRRPLGCKHPRTVARPGATRQRSD